MDVERQPCTVRLPSLVSFSFYSADTQTPLAPTHKVTDTTVHSTHASDAASVDGNYRQDNVQTIIHT